MGDVSNYGTSEYGPSDYQTIMAGGAHWMARMTAFLEAQEQAQAAIVRAGIVGDIVAAREGARLDRESAAKELDDARSFADGIVAKANAQADEILAKANDEAQRRLVDVSVAEDRARATTEDARIKMDEAQAAMSRVSMRNAEIDAILASVNKQSDDLSAAQADAEAMKARYQALADKLRAVLAEEDKA